MFGDWVRFLLALRHAVCASMSLYAVKTRKFSGMNAGTGGSSCFRGQKGKRRFGLTWEGGFFNWEIAYIPLVDIQDYIECFFFLSGFRGTQVV